MQNFFGRKEITSVRPSPEETKKNFQEQFILTMADTTGCLKMVKKQYRLSRIKKRTSCQAHLSKINQVDISGGYHIINFDVEWCQMVRRLRPKTLRPQKNFNNKNGRKFKIDSDGNIP